MTSETTVCLQSREEILLISEAVVNALLACFTVLNLSRSSCVYCQLPPVSASFAS